MTNEKTLRSKLQRIINAARKIRSGLPLFGENVSPEVPNDVFVAHASIYEFFSRHVLGLHEADEL